jgi:ABC-type lipoprotein export system ATPase subunit
MQIEFNQIMPEPLATFPHSEQSIWGKNFTLAPGERVLLNASSGKGKSTFTFLTFGLRHDYSGTIRFDGKDVRTLSLDEWTTIRQTKLAVIFQDLQLFPTYSVRENLMLKNMLHPLWTETEIRGMLERLGIGEKWDQRCGILSQGQQQRVAIIRALLQPFEWLIMDEPFSHLDQENARIAFELICEVSDKQHAGFVLTSLADTHNYAFHTELNL